jgi:hypothetical protein
MKKAELSRTPAEHHEGLALRHDDAINRGTKDQRIPRHRDGMPVDRFTDHHLTSSLNLDTNR